LLRIRQNPPDRFARGGDGGGERGIAVLQQGQHLQQQPIVLLPQLREAFPSLFVVKRPERCEQVVHLVLQRKLREDADGVGIFEALLQRGEVESRRWRWAVHRGGSRACRGGFSRAAGPGGRFGHRRRFCGGVG